MNSEDAQSGFKGLRVVAFESRLAEQMAQLVKRHGGRPLVAPSMREVPLDHNTDVLRFGEGLLAGTFSMVFLLTGVGATFMLKVLDTRWPRDRILAALRKTLLIVRGPKPLAVLRGQGLQPALAVPEPNTWRDLVAALDAMGRSLNGMQVAVQEYGITNVPLIEALRTRGAIVTSVPVYQWRLPEDTGPLQAAVQALITGEAQVALFTNAVQVDHMMHVANAAGATEQLRRALDCAAVCAVGPIVAERLRSYRLPVDFQPSHPKMGLLVKEASELAADILRRKR